MPAKKENKKKSKQMTGHENPIYIYETWLGALIALLIASIFGIVNFQCLTSKCYDGILLVDPAIEVLVIFITIFIGFIIGWITHILANEDGFRSVLFK